MDTLMWVKAQSLGKLEEVRMRKVADMMTVDPQMVNPSATLRQVMHKLVAEDCRQLPVVDKGGKLVGIITDRDVRLALNSPLVLHDRSQDEQLLDTVTAEALMTPDPIAVDPETPAAVAATMLGTYKFGALPVVSGSEVVGIVTVTDFLDWFSELNELDQVIEAEADE